MAQIAKTSSKQHLKTAAGTESHTERSDGDGVSRMGLMHMHMNDVDDVEERERLENVSEMAREKRRVMLWRKNM